MHHLSHGALAAAGSPTTPFVFTSHWLRQPSRARRAVARFVTARCDASVALSETELAWLRKALPTRGLRRVIPNGVVPRSFPHAEPPPSGPPWRLLYVGQLAAFKGLDHLFDALARLQGRLDVHLRIAHQTSGELAHLQALAERLGISAESLAPQPATGTGQLYADCHALVLPGSLGEALPTVVTEARLVGRPAIATDVGAVREQVDGFGQVVQPGSGSTRRGDRGAGIRLRRCARRRRR